MIDLLVPSAKIVPNELQNIGKLPAIIYPINDRTVFSYLYEQYSSSCNVKILCYENSDKVHKKLKKYSDVKVIDIPEIQDLADTILYGLDTSNPVIINFGDTIVTDNIFENDADCFYYAEEFVSDKWTYFDIEHGKLTNIYDKNGLPHSSDRKKLFVGVFYIKDSVFFKKCLEQSIENNNETISPFYVALKLYSESAPLIPYKCSNWFDIGHSDKYYDTKLEVKAREFNHIEIDKNRGLLTKFSSEKEKFLGEIKWYLKLPSDIEYLRPRIFDYSVDYNNPYVCMEYYAYHTVHELFLNSDLDVHKWESIFKRINFICQDMKRYKVSDNNIKSSLEEMYLNKTLQRFKKLNKSDNFKKFFTSPIIVNGVMYQSLNNIVELLKMAIPEELYDVREFNIIHGDLCFANMMIDNNFSFIKVIDPRGKFGSFDIYGDFRYELAKLFHSVDGKYDYIIKDLFFLSYNELESKIDFTIQDKDRDFDLFKVFKEVFKEDIGTDIKKIELIESLLFLSMIPLHSESFDHQLVMLGTGLEILNRVVNIVKE